MSNHARAERWIERALGWADRDLAPNGTVYYEGDTIFSYGRHFPMAIVMRERLNRDSGRRFNSSPTVGEPHFILVNGDSYSVTTAGHQSMVRGVIASKASWLESIIIPFSALSAAGIEPESIEPLEIRPDRNETFRHRAESNDSRLGAPYHVWDRDAESYVRVSHQRCVGRRTNWPIATLDPEDGLWHWETHRHWLGDSLFQARSNGRRRRFLSSFDYQEAQPLYFLCELPRASKARTVEEAYEDLKPQAVKDAEAAGLEPSRQGDMFAIPTELSTREVKLLTPHRKGRIVKRPPRGLLGTNHTASEVIFCTHGRVYARGLLYHEPGFHRPPDHARRKMGDGKTWHLLIKNTVPRAQPRTREAV